ncbi:hypothetical protein L2D14_14885 [Thalassospiraceae bacterium LMO-JJ14]|nr:hypothetical protein L2D14_14885 [Thalassospiraceae bacterium LMO-JJ14]
MSEVTPPSAAPPPPALATLQRIIIITAPPALAELPAGTKLDVLVADIVDAAQIRLSTRLGDISLKAPQPLPVKTGDALILQLVSGGNNPRVQLATTDGRTLPLLARGAATTSPQASSTPLQGPGTAAAQIIPGAFVTANLLRPVSVNAALILQAKPSPGGSLQATQQGPGLSGPKPGVQAGQAQPAHGQTTQTLAGTTGTPSSAASQSNQGQVSKGPAAQGQAGQGNTTIPATSRLEIKITTVNIATSPPGRLTPGPAQGQISLAPGATLTGIVSGRQGIGQTVVQTHAGPISLPTLQAFPPGSEIRFEIVSLKPPVAGTAQHGPLHGGVAPILDGSWGTFSEALDILRDVAPGAHQHVMQAALPRADAQMATNVLFFLSALRGGDIKNWLGDGPVRILEKMRPDLAGRLRSDMTQMTRSIDDPQSGEWRLHGVPFLFGADIDRIQFLVRDQENDEDGDEESKGGTRFVVDLELSRLGHLQIDGLVGEKNKRLDLVLRTDEPLQPHVRDDIRRIYNDALELTGLEGSVGFQAQPGNFVNIPKRMPTTGNNGVIA